MQSVQLDKTIEQLNYLDRCGMLADLQRKGLVHNHIFIWLEIYDDYQIELTKTGSILQAMENTATNKGVSIELIRKIRKKIE